MLNKTRGVGGKLVINENARYKVVKPEAEMPVAETGSLPFYEITAVARTDNRQEDVVMQAEDFETGIEVVPPAGFHFELLPHPDLARNGYMLPGPLIIEEGPLIVPLIKIAEKKDDIQLPFKVAVLVVRETQNYFFARVGAPTAKVNEPRKGAQKGKNNYFM